MEQPHGHHPQEISEPEEISRRHRRMPSALSADLAEFIVCVYWNHDRSNICHMLRSFIVQIRIQDEDLCALRFWDNAPCCKWKNTEKSLVRCTVTEMI